MLADINQRLSACLLVARTPSSGYAPTCAWQPTPTPFYLACDERRRLCNQAFFTKITVTENLDVSSEFTGVYEAILDPTNQLHAGSGSAPASSPRHRPGPQRSNPAHRSRGQGWNFDQMVDLTGYEPVPSRCAEPVPARPGLPRGERVGPETGAARTPVVHLATPTGLEPAASAVTGQRGRDSAAAKKGDTEAVARASITQPTAEAQLEPERQAPLTRLEPALPP